MTVGIAAIIQARMGSTRLPGKTLAPIQGKPMIQHLVQRVQASSLVEDVIIATTTKDRDDVLVEFAQGLGLKCYRGSEEDVLDRVYQAARRFGVDHIVRVTPDCPLLDHQVMDGVIEAYLSGDYDYVTNTPGCPDGLDVEVFSFRALERAWEVARLPSEREHITEFLQNSGEFRLFHLAGPVDLSHFKWSVDTQEDLDFVRAVYERLEERGDIFYLEDVLTALRRYPQLMTINQSSIPNQGHYKALAGDPPIPASELPVGQSYALKDKAQSLIPSCTQTFSKGPTQFVQGVAPVFLERGHGCHVWDVDGNRFIDYSMGLGPVILGHNYPAVTEAAIRQMKDGVAFSLPHRLEVELAELLVEIIPCAEMVRFGKNGSDATSGAVRLARAYTGRDVIACCGYHGWQDWYIGTTTRNKGVPQAVQELTIPFQYNDIASLERIFTQHSGKVAAVIMEPVGVVEPQDDFLQTVRDLAHREGALLVFDEIITGFRLALGGAQEFFGVEPDLACFGKGMANGFPLSAVVGRREIMELFDEVFFSFTFGGEAVSLAACIATINEIREKNVIAHLWAQGRKLKDGYNVLAREFEVEHYTECIGYFPRTVVSFKDDTGAASLVVESLFQQECLKRELLFTGGHNICYSHTDRDIDYTLRVYRTALEILAQAIKEGDVAERVEGTMLEPVFRQP